MIKPLSKQLQATFFILGLSLFSSASFAVGNPTESELINRGRYVVKTTGCNDCHTPKYGEMNGVVPENQWLIGVGVGYKGPWGTTYPANLRHLLSDKSEAQWLRYARHMKSKPPMPWYNVNAMTDDDLRAMFHFIRFLGDDRNAVPQELPPGAMPKTPYINFEVVMPKVTL